MHEVEESLSLQLQLASTVIIKKVKELDIDTERFTFMESH